MPLDLTHLGEAIVQRLIEQRPNRFFELCGIPQSSSFGGAVFRGVTLTPYGGKHFDGASRIDLVVPLSATTAMPVEVKLGGTRLSKTLIDDQWLAGCRPSHQGKRWAGNMMSVLDRRFPEGTPEQALVTGDREVQYSLTPRWCVVVRRRTLEAWAKNGRPNFRNACVVDFDTLAEEAGPLAFDQLVGELLAFSFYQAWVTGR